MGGCFQIVLTTKELYLEENCCGDYQILLEENMIINKLLISKQGQVSSCRPIYPKKENLQKVKSNTNRMKMRNMQAKILIEFAYFKVTLGKKKVCIAKFF